MKEKIITTFRALRSRNFRLFLFGQGVSVMGTQMQRIALSWLVYQLTNSAFLLGLVAFVSSAPIIFAPFAGVILDRYPRIRILKLTQIIAMLQAFVLYLLVLFDAITVWQIIVLGFILGLVNMFDIPGRQSFYVKMLDHKDDLPNAIALNSITFHTSRIIGPSVAGIVIALFGEGACFLLNAVSYGAVLYSLFIMKVYEGDASTDDRAFIQELREGFVFIRERPSLKYILFLVGCVSISGWSYAVLLPIFAKDILGGDSIVFGFLTSAISVGSIFGAFFLASRGDADGIDRRAVIFAGVFGVCMIVFAFTRTLYASYLTLMAVGLSALLHHASANSFFQLSLSEETRGRAMSLYVLAHQGFMPIGNLMLGTMAGWWGAPAALIIGGGISMFSALLFAPKILSYSRAR